MTASGWPVLALDGLPPPLPDRLRQVAAAAGGAAWLVGGYVRDLLLGRTPGDLDVVVERPAAEAAERLGVDVVQSTRFLTLTVRWPDGDEWDLVTARRERYRQPADLPTVEPADLAADLARRDFTVNAVAADLSEAGWGRLVDPLEGLADLRRGVVRALHERSFVDDPTRLYRAARYAVRLGFAVEPETLAALRAAVNDGLVDRLSGDRLRHELERTLAEPDGAAHAACLAELGLLGPVDARLSCDGATMRRGDALLSEWPSWGQAEVPAAWLVRLLVLLPEQDAAAAAEAVCQRLRPVRRLEQATRAWGALLQRGWSVAGAPSAVVQALDGLELETALAAAAKWPAAREQCERYLTCWRHVRPALDGHDLRSLGVAPGPEVGRILATLREARLDGRVADREGEWLLARELVRRGR